MARVFTITPGLENMGGMKTGGQGSVYKGRRMGEIITAVKILPTPIFTESADDRNFAAFQKEVGKLKKVNDKPNPHVVKMLSSGISDTGGFPYIEMEYIEGADLQELLTPPNNPIFTLQETLKVAEQLANALAHCHERDVRHGDVKSGNVKLNSNTGNYILLDFGLAIMSDEQRRSSLGQVGAIEFMAPEQNTGQMLFQTDVYSYGAILFELLTGTVPFIARDKSDSARNEVRLAHMVTPVPNLLDLRRAALPERWSNEKKGQEMQVPGWLVSMVYKCLEKKPEKRFANGSELHKNIIQHFFSRPDDTARLNQLDGLARARQVLLDKQQQLNNELSQYRQELIKKEGELINLRELVSERESGLQAKSHSLVKVTPAVSKKGVSTTSFTALLLVTFALGAFLMFPIFKNKSAANPNVAEVKNNTHDDLNVNANTSTINEQDHIFNEPPAPIDQESQNDEPLKHSDTIIASQNNESNSQQDNQQVDQENDESNDARKPAQKPADPPVNQKPIQQKNENEVGLAKPVNQPPEKEIAPQRLPESTEDNSENNGPATNSVSKKYLVVSNAYFYNDPDENTKREEFISTYEHAVVLAQNERYSFIYVVITNPQGQVFKGWLRKRDLKLYSIE